MTWTAPTNVTTGTLITAARWNSDVVANTTYLGNTHNHVTSKGAGGGAALGWPSVMVRNSTAQAIARGDSGTIYSLAFDTAISNIYSMWASGANGKLTIPATGTYWLFASIAFVTSDNTAHYLWLRKNGDNAQVVARDVRVGAGGLPTQLFVGVLVRLTLNDYVEARVLQDSVGNLDVEASDANQPMFGAIWVSA